MSNNYPSHQTLQEYIHGSSVWKHPASPSPTKALISKSVGKVMSVKRYNFTGIYYATDIKSELLPAINPFMPSGFFCFNSLDRAIPCKGCLVGFYYVL